MFTLKCPNCGGELIRKENLYVCPYCNSEFEEESAAGADKAKRDQIYELIRKGEFAEAEELCNGLIEKKPDFHEGYWMRALARHGVIFVKDIGDKMIPTCQCISKQSFLEDADVKKAISCAPPALRENYEKQARRIEEIRREWFEKASKEKPYDVFLCYKESDKEHGIERTKDSEYVQDLYNYLQEKGLRVFYSRVSLMGKVSDHYEPYIFSALTTAKVMVVYGEQAEYFNATWLRNEWSRFVGRIVRENLPASSLIVAYKGVDPYRIPSALLGGRQGLDMTKPSAFNLLVERIEEAVRSGKKTITLERKEITGGQIAKKAARIGESKIETREIGAGAAARLNFSLESKLKMTKNYLAQSMWEEANRTLMQVLNETPENGEALFYELLIRTHCKNLSEFYRLKRFSFCELLSEVLAVADEKLAIELLDVMYDLTALPESDYLNVLQVILPYKYKNRQTRIDIAFERSIHNGNRQVFDLLLKTLSSDEVDRYIELNGQMISQLLTKKDYRSAEEYCGNVLKVDEGNVNVLRVRCEMALEDESDKTGKEFEKRFEALLKYAKDAKECITYFLQRICADARITPQECAIVKIILKYHKGALTELKLSGETALLKIADLLLRNAQFEDAAYFANLILAEDDHCAGAWLCLALSEAKARTIYDVPNSDIPIGECKGFDEYCALSDDAKQQELFIYVRQQKENVAVRAKQNAVRKRERDKKRKINIINGVLAVPVGFFLLTLLLAILSVSPFYEFWTFWALGIFGYGARGFEIAFLVISGVLYPVYLYLFYIQRSEKKVLTCYLIACALFIFGFTMPAFWGKSLTEKNENILVKDDCVIVFKWKPNSTYGDGYSAEYLYVFNGDRVEVPSTFQDKRVRYGRANLVDGGHDRLKTIRISVGLYTTHRYGTFDMSKSLDGKCVLNGLKNLTTVYGETSVKNCPKYKK